MPAQCVVLEPSTSRLASEIFLLPEINIHIWSSRVVEVLVLIVILRPLVYELFALLFIV